MQWIRRWRWGGHEEEKCVGSSGKQMPRSGECKRYQRWGMSMKGKGRGSRIGQGEPRSEMQVKSWATRWGTSGQRCLVRGGSIGQKCLGPSDPSRCSQSLVGGCLGGACPGLKTETDPEVSTSWRLTADCTSYS